MADSAADTTSTPEAKLQSLIERFAPEDRTLFGAVRSAVRKRFPTANELLYDYTSHIVIAYSPTERPTEGIASIALRGDGVRLYLMHGPQLPDPKKLLKGTGTQARFLRVEAASRLADPDVEALIAAAIDRADVPLAAEGRGRLIVRTYKGP